MNLRTFKGGRYAGPGDPLSEFTYKGHVPFLSPFQNMPVFPGSRDGRVSWFHRDLRTTPYVEAEWTATKTNSGAVDFTGGTLNLTTGVTDGNNTVIQFLRTYTPAANKIAYAFGRLQVDDATNSDMYFGYWAADTDPSSTEPTHSAMFKKDDADTIVNGRTNDGGTGTETANLITDYTAATYYDFGVIIAPTSASAGSVYFQYKLASSNTWAQATPKTTDFPASAIRFGIANISGGGAIAMNVKDLVFGWME